MEINQGYTTMHGQPVIKIMYLSCMLCWAFESPVSRQLWGINQFRHFKFYHCQILTDNAETWLVQCQISQTVDLLQGHFPWTMCNSHCNVQIYIWWTSEHKIIFQRTRKGHKKHAVTQLSKCIFHLLQTGLKLILSCGEYHKSLSDLCFGSDNFSQPRHLSTNSCSFQTVNLQLAIKRFTQNI